MERHDILDIWKQPDCQFRRIAVSEALRLLPHSFGLCLQMLADCPEEQAWELVVPLRKHMPFLHEGYSPAVALPEGSFDVFPEWAEQYKAAMASLGQEADPRLPGVCYRYFNALRSDLQTMYPHYDFSDCLREEEKSFVSSHQLMVFVTGVCNLQCPYCFSSDIEHTYISADDLRRIFAWAAKNDCSMVTPCGGEPMLYPHIGLFFDLVADYGMRTYMASNCTMPLSRLTPKQLGTIDVLTCHMTESLWKRQEYMKTFCENLQLAQQMGIKIIARANIVSPNEETEPWFELVERYGLDTFYISTPIPSGAHDNLYIDPATFVSYVPVIKRCIGRCRERHINIGFAKPIPLCIFDRETASWLMQSDRFLPLCNNHEDGGTRNACISPDMHIEPCPGVPRPRIPFSESITWKDLETQLGAEIHRALQKPLFERCSRCFLSQRRICQGACLSYKYLTKA